jgi:hypothetical protein
MTGPASSSGAAAEAQAWRTAPEFLRRRSELIRFDSALRAFHDNLATTFTGGQLKHLPLTQTDLDVQSRAEALAAIAARSAGRPIARAMSGGGRIDAPLPFGGPSRKQRERDSTIDAQTKETLSRVQRRLDSAATTRRRRHTDSLARVEDSLRRSSQTQH